MYDEVMRERKAHTMVAILRDFLGPVVKQLSVLDIGASTGIIDSCLASEVGSVVGMDIDESAVAYACKKYWRENLFFCVGDALDVPFGDDTFDIVICSQIYEHVADAWKMMDEVWRVLVPGGVCYFAAGNKIMWKEPHYQLPLLSLLPRPLGHMYLQLMGKGSRYHELHYTFWGLRKLAHKFSLHDYTAKVVRDPSKFGATYMIRPGSFKASLSRIISKYLIWLAPGYIWILEKPDE